MNQHNDATIEHRVAERPRNQRLELLLLGALFALIATVSVGVTWQVRRIRADRSAAAPALPPPKLGDVPIDVPDFSLVDQDNKPVTLGDLKGHVWVANFFFTSCPVQCPMMNTKLAQIRQALPEGAPAKLISITVDPDNDSPEVLADYAKTFRATDERWLFLTGDKQAIIRLARDGFKLPATDDPNVHSLRLVLVDRNGRIRGYFDSTDNASIKKLQTQMKSLLAKEMP
jgi:cytochrome oxidase Cu insertion factor (SCO1/SenC/PrrC family)